MNKNELSGFTIYLTNDCNLRCKHCWISGGQKADYLDYKLIQKRVSEAVEMGVKYFLLTGGEPFMHPDIDNIISHIVSQEGVFLSVETNATMIHDEQIRQLAKYNDRVKLIASVDASSSKIHDEIRGITGAFDITINTVKKLVKNGLLEQCIMAVSKINVDDIENTIRLCISNGVKYLRVLPVQPCGRGELMSEESVTFSVQEQIHFYEKVQLLAQEYQDDIKVRTPVPPAFLKLSKIKHYQNECSFCNRLTLLANGRYSMCGIGEAHSDYQFGIPYSTSVYDCWNNNDRVQEIFNNIHNNYKIPCSICIYKSLCKGFCQATAVQLPFVKENSYRFCEEAYKLGLFPKNALKNRRKDYENI